MILKAVVCECGHKMLIASELEQRRADRRRTVVALGDYAKTMKAELLIDKEKCPNCNREIPESKPDIIVKNGDNNSLDDAVKAVWRVLGEQHG